MQLRDMNSARFPNMWCFPGGTCDPGEKFTVTAIREIAEEFDVSICNDDLELLFLRDNEQTATFICHVRQDCKPALNECAAIEWMSIEQVEKIPLGFGHEEIIQPLKEYLASKVEVK